MPLAPIVAAALTTPVNQIAWLNLNGQSILRPPAGGNGPGVPVETISVTEAPPGSVSTMSFELEDPLTTLTAPTDGAEVEFWDNVLGIPIFAGWVDDVEVRPHDVGRTFRVSCTGVEAILDWAILTADLVVPAGITLTAATQLIAANAEGIGELRTFGTVAGGSDQPTPVGDFVGSPLWAVAPTLAYAITIPAGTSLRDALTAAGSAAIGSASVVATIDSGAAGAVVSSTSSVLALFTVDFWRGLRGMPDSALGRWSVDRTNQMTITDQPALANKVAENLRDAVNAANVARGVYVKGLNAASSGYYGDGTGKRGRILFVSDTAIDSARKANDAAVTALSANGVAFRGSFELVDYTPIPQDGVGMRVVITDAQAGLNGVTRRITGIRKYFHSTGRQDWSISYGMPRPQITRLIRRLTKTTRN